MFLPPQVIMTGKGEREARMPHLTATCILYELTEKERIITRKQLSEDPLIAWGSRVPHRALGGGANLAGSVTSPGSIKSSGSLVWFVHMATTVGNYLKFDSKRQMHLGQVEIREMGTRKKEEGRSEGRWGEWMRLIKGGDPLARQNAVWHPCLSHSKGQYVPIFWMGVGCGTITKGKTHNFM